ncbi:hypothetical protein MPTK1_4g23770 [Marchantia polymorpha subsp. ruderalis]|uniref:DUF1995 domain-containing protein n=2 Tax=Marchantia polymorpha TaxID=3197 RepID=A0AAF6BD39_MARPO|nr:hypothetical protein MARPO_0020s0140 [Marchantia polymorpha]BBN09923.1 hypothetical protein Mp_4g23770 [Marchantia polymorpha subsp. ruderalis]|eukprot:PTQ44500.1 hypothetical protein MARPO_0020s0140 [Marchantia polymorpha]
MALLSSASALHHRQQHQLLRSIRSTIPSPTSISSTAAAHLSSPRCRAPLAALEFTTPTASAPGALQLPHLLSSSSPSAPRRFSRCYSNSRVSRHLVRAAADERSVLPQQKGDEPAGAAVEKKREFFLPSTLEESIDQARTASRQAIKDGIKRMQLEVLLPLIGATDLDDWPGGIQQQFKAAGPVVTSLLSGLVDSDNYKAEGGYRSYIIDDSDAVGAWENDDAALVLFPTAESLDSVQALAAAKEDRPLLLVNVQWQSGQVISDFGFGAQKRSREEFVNSFEVVYFLKQMRMLGEDLRLLKRYPGDWQVFVMDAAGGSECVAVEPQRPSYKALEALLKSRKGSKAGQGWLSRLFSEFEFNQKSLKD